MMYKYLSNGAMYDPKRFMYIEFDNSKPQPHNRTQTLLFYLNIKKLQNLTDQEIDYMIQESRSSKPPCVKQQKWYKDTMHQRHREYMIAMLKHDYWWEVCAKIQYKYTKEQLEKMPWTESRHKKHERVLGPTLWEWVKKARPNQYHALYGNRSDQPGVIRYKNRMTKYSNNYGQFERLSSRVGTGNSDIRRVQHVTSKPRQSTISFVSRTTTRPSRDARKTRKRAARAGNHRG